MLFCAVYITLYYKYYSVVSYAVYSLGFYPFHINFVVFPACLNFSVLPHAYPAPAPLPVSRIFIFARTVLRRTVSLDVSVFLWRALTLL